MLRWRHISESAGMIVSGSLRVPFDSRGFVTCDVPPVLDVYMGASHDWNKQDDGDGESPVDYRVLPSDLTLLRAVGMTDALWAQMVAHLGISDARQEAANALAQLYEGVPVRFEPVEPAPEPAKPAPEPVEPALSLAPPLFEAQPNKNDKKPRRKPGRKKKGSVSDV